MRRLYVVYDSNDRPYAECEKFRDAYSQAFECIRNHGGPVGIDIYFWDGARGYKHMCSNGDFYFIDRKGEAILPEDLEEMGVVWYQMLYFKDEDQLAKLEFVGRTFEFEFNDIALDVYKRFYSINRKNDSKKKRNSTPNT